MGLFKSLKGKLPDHIGGDTDQSYSQYQDSTEKQRVFGDASAGQSASTHYEAPAGPPPKYNKGMNADDQFEPPLGPPPGHKDATSASEAPQGPPPPYHDWTVIPDTALLPPPPSIRYDYSNTGNAPEYLADMAHEWCNAHALFAPSRPHHYLYESVEKGDVKLVRPAEFAGDIAEFSNGFWKGRTKSGSKDSILLTRLPLYFAAQDSPLDTERTKSIYFEVKIAKIGRGRGSDEASLAIGFCAQPYPTWRLPGWERGSLGVHSDDGRRYVNDSWGGKDFTIAFKAGETIGLGMEFKVPRCDGDETQSRKADVEVFLTRNGSRAGGWNLQEELDEASGDIEGLTGDYDLYGGIGTFGSVEFEVSFAREHWLYQPAA
ncbi:MAG: hypothetical protein Q9227_000366 [Pyrenula ochraceoflavens]